MVEHQVLEVRQEQKDVCIGKDNLAPLVDTNHSELFAFSVSLTHI